LLIDFQPGQTIAVDVQRFGTKRTLQVKLGEPPDEAQTTASGAGVTGGARLGVGVAPVTPDMIAQLQLPASTQGLIIERVDPSGPAAGLLQPGDIITEALGAGAPRSIRTTEDLHNALSRAPRGVLSLQVYSVQGQTTRVVNIQLTP
jgi:serine protease Do